MNNNISNNTNNINMDDLPTCELFGPYHHGHQT